MTLRVDHVFVCTSAGAPEAQELLDAGLVEGSPNTHPGQGSANRRFFFENGFLELLWVTDEAEARSALTAPTRLWERWVGRAADANPFGICIASEQGAASLLPFASWAYEPDYLPDDRAILFAEDQPLAEPELFALSWPHAFSPGKEPTAHPLGLRALNEISIGLPDPTAASESLRAARDTGLVKIHASDAPELVIEFMADRDVEVRLPTLSLTLIGRTQGDAKHDD